MAVSAFPRVFRSSLIAASLALAPALAAQTLGGFDPNVAGTVYAMAVQADGRIVFGGNFTSLRPDGASASVARGNAARVNADGTLDASFDPEADGMVTCLAVQPDGRVIIGGYFTHVAPNGGAKVTRNHIARFNANGTLDASFDPSATGSLTSPVSAIAIQSNGQIVIGGNFTALQPNGSATPIGLNRIARLNSDGTVDRSFNPNANGSVNAIAINSNDGTIVIGGAFTGIGLTTRNHVARLSSTGALDTSFDPNVNGGINAIAYDGGKIVIGGSFTTIQPNGSGTVTNQNYVARLNSDGTQDTSFEPQPSAAVNSIVVRPNGDVFLGGAFVNIQQNGTVNGTATLVSTVKDYYVALVDGTTTAVGTPITTFQPNPNYIVYAMALDAAGNLVIGGSFTQVVPIVTGAPVPGVTRNGIARINTDGSLDSNPDPNSIGGVGPVVVQSNGQILVGGTFTTIGGVTRHNLARLSASGVVDSAFDPEPNGAVTAIVLQSDGKIVIGGAFTMLQPNGAKSATAQAYLARLNTDGTLDTSFNPSLNDPVMCLAIEPDGRLLFGGTFTTVDALSVGHLGRLNANLTLDGNFNPNASDEVDAIALEPSDNAILIGGKFTTVSPEVNGNFSSLGTTYLARLNNNDGSLDPNFLPQPDGPVEAVVVQSDGKILIGGAFGVLQPGGATKSSITSSGSLTISNNPLFARNRIARLNTDGTVDTTFDPHANSTVMALTQQSDGKVLVGGYFTTFQPNSASPQTAVGLARLNTDGTLDKAFAPAVNGVVNSIAVQSDGKILPGGAFSQVLPTGGTVLQTRYHVTRFNTDGTLDSGFNVTSR